MRTVPFITTAIFAVGLSLLLAGYTQDNWSTVKSNLASGSFGLFSGCVDLHSPWTTPVGSYGVRKLPSQCFHLNRQSTMALGFSPKLFGLLKATRIMAAFGLGCTVIGTITTTLFTLIGSYPKGVVVLPLVMGVLSLLFNILSLSFYGGVHANSYASEHSDFTHAKLGPAWVLTLIGSIISFLTLPANIVDLALPEAKRRNVRPASSINPSAILSGLLPAAKQMAPGGGGNVNMNEPAAVH